MSSYVTSSIYMYVLYCLTLGQYDFVSLKFFQFYNSIFCITSIDILCDNQILNCFMSCMLTTQYSLYHIVHIMLCALISFTLCFVLFDIRNVRFCVSLTFFQLNDIFSQITGVNMFVTF